MKSVSIRIDKQLYDLAQQSASAEYRSAPQQIALWAMVGRNALANPDLPVDFVYELLIAANRNELSDFEFEGNPDDERRVD